MAEKPLKMDKIGRHMISVRVFVSTIFAHLAITFAYFQIFCMQFSRKILEFGLQIFRETKIKIPNRKINYKFSFTLIWKISGKKNETCKSYDEFSEAR